MKRIRIAASLMISAALMASAVGVQAASSDEGTQVAFALSASFCGSLDQLLIDGGVVEPDGDHASVNIEIVGSAPRRSPVSPWLILDPIDALFKCDGPGTRTLSTDIAAAP